jgi:hypothetical protein
MRVLLLAVLVLLTSCRAQPEPQGDVGCGASPPEDSRDYTRWNARQDAACKRPTSGSSNDQTSTANSSGP